MQRRDFIRGAARSAAAAAIPVAGVAAAHGADLFAHLDRSARDLARQLDAGVRELGDQVEESARELGLAVRDVRGRVRNLAARVDLLELRYRLVLSLLVLSLVIDGGMSWMLLTASPVPVIA